VSKSGVGLDFVLEIDVAEGRDHSADERAMVHPGSGRVYHVRFQSAKVAGKDDVTGEPLIQRDDDREETVRKRLEVYRKQTRPLVD